MISVLLRRVCQAGEIFRRAPNELGSSPSCGFRELTALSGGYLPQIVSDTSLLEQALVLVRTEADQLIVTGVYLDEIPCRGRQLLG